MPSYLFPKKNSEFVFYIGLVDQADTKLFKSSPTIAAGDFKVSTDGSALANPATLPSVDPAASKLVKVTLSASEMNGDNIQLVASDAAGAEWCDALIQIQTSARQVDDLAFPVVSGRGLDVTATGAAGIDWGNVENPTTAQNLSGTNIKTDQVVASVTGAVGSVTGAVGSVTGSVGSLAAQAKADVNAEVVDVMSTDVIAEAAGVPGATGTIAGMLARLYAALRSGVTVTSAKKQYANDAGAIQWEKDLADAAGTYTESAGNAP